MNAIEKKKVRSTLKYTWPFYIIVAGAVSVLLYFIFGLAHRTPAYKTLTIFVSGEVTNFSKLENELLKEYEHKELKTFSCITSKVSDADYQTKLTINGYNGADVLVIPESKLDTLTVSSFALDLNEQLVNDYFEGCEFYKQNSVNYGVKINKHRVKAYLNLPEDDCYMVLNAKSANIGAYSSTHDRTHDLALLLVHKWGN